MQQDQYHKIILN